MSEHFPIAPNKKDKNVLVPFSNGRIEVMQLSDHIDEAGRQIAYMVGEDGESLVTRAGVPEAYSDKVQAHYAHKLAMDRNPTPEQMERGTPPKVITELGDVALEATMNLSAPAEVADASTADRESNQETGLDIRLVEGTVSTLSYATENLRHMPEAEAKHELNVHIVRQASNAHDRYEEGKIDKASYSTMTHALLGAASDFRIIDAVSDQLMDGRTLDSDETADLTDWKVELYEIASKTGLDADIARIRLASNLISRSEYILERNDGVANNRYRAMVGFIAGLSTQIKDSSTSFGFVSGALEQLKKHS
jgi:hypothetical protein